MAAGFIFGGNTGETAQSLARKRAVAEALMERAVGDTPRNVGEGLATLGSAIAGRIAMNRLDKQEKAGREATTARVNEAIKNFGGDGGASAGDAYSTPSASASGSAASGGAVDVSDSSPVFDEFMDTVKNGGVSNPYALAAIASTGKAESGWSPENANRRWSDPSESGQAGTAGGVMSWRNDRLANLEAFAKMAGEDPRKISAGTQAKFFLQEDPKLIESLNGAGSVEDAQRLMDGAWKYAGYDKPSKEAANRLSAANAYLPRFQSGAGPATATDETADYIAYANQGATRNRPLSGELSSALSFLPELGVTAEVFSGGQPSANEGGARTGSSRHDHGNAADVHFMKDGRRLDWANPEDLPIFEEIVRRGKAAGITGFGAGEGYMQPGSMHIGFGDPAVWGAGGSGDNAPEWLRNAYNGSPVSGGGEPRTAAEAVTAMGQGGRDTSSIDPLAYASPSINRQTVPESLLTADQERGTDMQTVGSLGGSQVSPAVLQALVRKDIPAEFQGSKQLQTAADNKRGIIQALMEGTPASDAQLAQARARDNPVAQALARPSQHERNPLGIDPSVIELMNDPYISEGQRAVLGTFIDDQLAQRKARRDAELKRSDPAYRLDIAKSEAELAKLNREAKLPAKRDTSIVNGRLVDNQTGEVIADFPDQVKPTADIQNYEYYAEQERKAGKEPLGPLDWLKEQRKAGATNVNVGGGGDNKQVFDAVADSTAAARSAATGLNSLREAKKAVDSGIFSGAAADWRLGLQKVGAMLGVADPKIIENTETFRAAIAPQVAAMMKATVGSTQISNADREFAEKAAGGSISLNEGSIRKLIDIMERAGTAVINDHKGRLDLVYPEGQGFERERALFGVDMPKMDEPPTGAAEAIDAARKAIAAGASRDAVIQRLRENGIGPEGL
jgi:hypothetical protein